MERRSGLRELLLLDNGSRSSNLPTDRRIGSSSVDYLPCSGSGSLG